MKCSRYNFILEKNDNVFCFNATTFRFFILKSIHKHLLEEVFVNPSLLVSLPHFANLLKEGRFLINDDENELEYVHLRNKEVENSPNYKLIILPTFACNFSCWYCVQHHKKEFMSEETISLIQKHIANVIESKSIKSLNIEWFGGEPLLGFKKVIYPLSSFVKEVCEKNAIPFFNAITTNGYLIDKRMLAQMKELNFKGFQITLDGNREFHDKVRVAHGQSSFDVILENINWICDHLPEAAVKIRINYDNENFDPEIFLNQVEERIDKKYNPQIEFLLRKVWQVELLEENKRKNIDFVDAAMARGFCVSEGTFLNTTYTRCYVCKKNFNTIAPNGNIYKCTDRNDYTQIPPLGTLNKNGNIEWTNPNFEKIYFNDKLSAKAECKECKYLPICWGTCPKALEENQLKDTPFKCVKPQQNDLSFEESILAYCTYYNKQQ